MADTVAFERSHDIFIEAPPAAVFDYVSNPQSWPEWLAASHEIESENRPLATGEAFHEEWSTRKGSVRLDWVVMTCKRPTLWVAETNTDFIGPIIAQYTCTAEGSGTRYTRTIRNPGRPKMPTADMIERIDEEAPIALRNIKANVERRAGVGRA